MNSTAKYAILEQGQEPGKDQWYARCLYEDQVTDVTVIIDGAVLRYLKQRGVFSFPMIVEAALDAAQEVDRHPKQVAVLMDTPILQSMLAKFRHDG
jgi:ABC-type molybdate transport system permease subunit